MAKLRKYSTLEDCLEALRKGFTVDEVENSVPWRTMDALWLMRESYQVAAGRHRVALQCGVVLRDKNIAPLSAMPRLDVPRPAPGDLVILGHYRYEGTREIRWVDAGGNSMAYVARRGRL